MSKPSLIERSPGRPPACRIPIYAALVLLMGTTTLPTGAAFAAGPTGAAFAAGPTSTACAAGSEATPALWPSVSSGTLIQPAVESYLDGLLAAMTLEEKIGQMVQADIGSITPEDLAQYHLGSVLAGGLAAPAGNVHSGPAAWRDLVARYKIAALAASPGKHQAIPIIFGIDAVHGDAKIRGATIFPHNIGLGAAHDPALIRQIGGATAQEVAATGVDWAFAPTLAVVRDVRWGRSYESYSDDPTLVAAYAASMVAGLQGALGSAEFLATGHVLAAAKHFIGDGGTRNGRDQGNDCAPETILRDVHGAGYIAALEAGVGSVMASYNSWQGMKMHANASLLTGVLKQRWHFGGFVIGDWNAQEELPGCSKFSCPSMINAGVDLVMAPDSWKQMYGNLLRQARRGQIPATRINDAVRRILRVKALMGLIGPLAHTNTPPSLDVVGSAAHRALARQAVRESLVLLKNEQNLLPLSPHQRVLVVGDAAASIGQQSGGWTVDWQGANNTNADLPGATSILDGIRAAVIAGSGAVAFSSDGRFSARPDVAIVVYGEQPYAEFEGDRENLLLSQSDKISATLQRLHDAGVRVVSVLLSGRPLWVNPQLNRSDAFVAAWLPGSEGGGVADLLFKGPVPRGFTGQLSFPWPQTGMPVTYTNTGAVSGALFARGYGLAAGQANHLSTLPENPRVPPQFATADSLFAAGHVVAPWSIYAADDVAEVRMTQQHLVSPGGVLQTSLVPDGVVALWSGHGEGLWRIGGRPADWSGLSGQGITVSYRFTHTLPAKLQMGMLCGEHCGAWLNVGRAMAQLPGTGLHEITVPLTCFAARGANLAAVETPFALRSTGMAGIDIDTIRLTKAEGPCPQG